MILHRPNFVTRYTSAGPARIRNWAASDPPERLPKIPDLGDKPAQPPPWEDTGPMPEGLFATVLLSYVFFVIGFGSNMIRNLMQTATGPSTNGFRRIWNIIPEHPSEEFKRFNKRTAAIEYPFNTLAALTALITSIILGANKRSFKIPVICGKFLL